MNLIYWIIEYSATFCEFFLCTVFSKSIIKNSDDKNNYLQFGILSFVLSLIMINVNNFKLYSPITAVIGVALMVLSSVIVNIKNPLRAVALGIAFLAIIAVIDNTVSNIIAFLIKIPITEINKELSIYRTFAVISSKSFLTLLTIMLNKYFFNKKNPNMKYMFFLFAVTSVMLLMTCFITFIDIKNDSINSYILILFFITMFVLLMTILFGVFKLTEYYENQQKLKLITLKNHMLEQSMTETEQTFMLWKTSLHDFKHKIINLMTLAENNDIQGIKQYLENENNLLVKKLFYYKTGNDTVDTILNIKQKYAEDKKITFIINAEVPQNSSILSADFATILGNLIDNAIEYSEYEFEPYIEVKIKPNEKFLIIVVSNKCTKNNIDLKTSKSNKVMHGMGLYSVKRTVKQYDGEIVIKNSDDVFSVNIILPI